MELKSRIRDIYSRIESDSRTDSGRYHRRAGRFGNPDNSSSSLSDSNKQRSNDGSEHRQKSSSPPFNQLADENTRQLVKSLTQRSLRSRSSPESPVQIHQDDSPLSHHSHNSNQSSFPQPARRRQGLRKSHNSPYKGSLTVHSTEHYSNKHYGLESSGLSEDNSYRLDPFTLDRPISPILPPSTETNEADTSSSESLASPSKRKSDIQKSSEQSLDRGVHRRAPSGLGSPGQISDGRSTPELVQDDIVADHYRSISHGDDELLKQHDAEEPKLETSYASMPSQVSPFRVLQQLSRSSDNSEPSAGRVGRVLEYSQQNILDDIRDEKLERDSCDSPTHSIRAGSMEPPNPTGNSRLADKTFLPFGPGAWSATPQPKINIDRESPKAQKDYSPTNEENASPQTKSVVASSRQVAEPALDTFVLNSLLKSVSESRRQADEIIQSLGMTRKYNFYEGFVRRELQIKQAQFEERFQHEDLCLEILPNLVGVRSATGVSSGCCLLDLKRLLDPFG